METKEEDSDFMRGDSPLNRLTRQLASNTEELTASSVRVFDPSIAAHGVDVRDRFLFRPLLALLRQVKEPKGEEQGAQVSHFRCNHRSDLTRGSSALSPLALCLEDEEQGEGGSEDGLGRRHRARQCLGQRRGRNWR